MLFSLSLFISLIIRYCTLLKSAVSISRSLANYNADIRHGVRRVVYFEPISRFRRFRFATRTIFVSNIRGIRGTRSRIIVSIVVVPLDSSTVIAATVIVARRVEWNFAICNRVSRRKLVEENFVEFVRRGVSRFLNVSANCSHNRYLRSRNIEQRLHNKLANGKLHNYSAFLDPPCLLLIRKSMALHFAPYITLIRAALICRLTDFSITLLFRATCNVHPSPRVFRVYQRVVTCGQRATREII